MLQQREIGRINEKIVQNTNDIRGHVDNISQTSAVSREISRFTKLLLNGSDLNKVCGKNENESALNLANNNANILKTF